MLLPLIKRFFVMNGGQDEKCVYRKVSVALKWVCESRILIRVERRGPLNTSVSSKNSAFG